MKRGMDLLICVLGAIVYAPALLLIAFAIWLEDRRPIFFIQQRIGFQQRPFLILKFRTMRNGEVTRVGAFLRPRGLDELPQILNVLFGEMSFVGPRPLTREDVKRLAWTNSSCVQRWSVKPGLTGLAQVGGGKSARHSLTLDLVYVRTRSLALDLRLLGLSFAINIIGKRRTRQWMLKRAD